MYNFIFIIASEEREVQTLHVKAHNAGVCCGLSWTERRTEESTRCLQGLSVFFSGRQTVFDVFFLSFTMEMLMAFYCVHIQLDLKTFKSIQMGKCHGFCFV